MKSFKQTCIVTERCPDSHKVRNVNFSTSCVRNNLTYINGMINSKLNPDYLLRIMMMLGGENH